MKAVEFQFLRDSVKIVQIEAPVPAANQVRIKVVCSAIDTGIDAVIQKSHVGKYIHDYTEPLYLGWHYAGVVDELGGAVSACNDEMVRVGDVVGFLPYSPEQSQGAFAEYILVDPKQCTTYSGSKLNAKEAAAMATEYVTALQALRDCGRIVAKQSSNVLIIGGGGGVGMAAVQLSKHVFGATVTVSCSERDRARVEKAGADFVLTRESHPEALQADTLYDVIFDTPAVLEPGIAVQRLTDGGQYVAANYVAFAHQAVHIVNAEPRRDDLSLLVSWMEEGKIKVHIDSVFCVKDMTDAIRRQREKKTGRVVVKVCGGWA